MNKQIHGVKLRDKQFLKDFFQNQKILIKKFQYNVIEIIRMRQFLRIYSVSRKQT